MPRQNKHLRSQVAHKAAQMIAEEGIRDYAFAKRKAAKFFGLIGEDALPSNNEIIEAIKEHQAIFFNEEHKTRLRMLRLEALSLMKKLSTFNPYLTGEVLDGTASRYPTTHIELYPESMKEVEFFLLNQKILYKTRDRKIHSKDIIQEEKNVPVFTLEGSMGPIELLIYRFNDLKKNKLKASIDEIEMLF